MPKINSPRSVTRGNEIRGVVEVERGDLEGARNVSIMMFNELTFGSVKKNHSSWEMKKTYPVREAGQLFQLPFEFLVDARSPITYSGRKLKSRWKLKFKVDVVGGLDKEQETEVIVMR